MLKTHKAAGIFEFILLSVIWGTSFLFTKYAAVELGTFPTAWLRVSFGALTLLPLILWQRHLKTCISHSGNLITLGVLSAALPFACYAFALNHITTGLASIMNSTVPLFAALITWLVTRNTLTQSRLWGLFLGILGTIAVALNSPTGVHFTEGGSGWGVLACLTATLSYALSGVYTQYKLGRLKPLILSAGSLFWASVVLLVPALSTWPHNGSSWKAWLSILYVGVVCTAVANILFFRLIQKIGASSAATVTYVIPLVASILGVIVLDELFTLTLAVSAIVILLGVSLATGLLVSYWGKKYGR
ncbi:MAG: DMT family transporter [Gammaproteobacteria bacterium]|nr:DMT family transporter [Gammaproteobacteria bacterium]